MQDIMEFKNGELGNGVRCYEQDGTAYLHLDAVARGLGFTQVKNGVEYVKWERVNGYLTELGFSPLLGKDSYIPENIFYRLAMKAKNATAEKFQAWIADEVIPSIRKHGGYIAGQEHMNGEQLAKAGQAVAESVLNERDALRLKLFSSDPLDVVEAHKALVEMETRPLRETIEQQKPMVNFANAVTKSPDNIKIREMAKILKEHGIEIGEKRLFELLRNVGVLMKSNLPYQTYLDRGYFLVREGVYERGGENKLYMTTLVTPRGQVWLVNKVPDWMAA